MDKFPKNDYALITGASRGLGQAFAYELARQNYNIVLVSLPGEGLCNTAREIKKMGVDAVIFETDLTKKKNLLELARWVNKNFKVKILINNAGKGGDCKFLEADVNYIDNIIQINMRATALLTRLILPNLLERDRAFLLNISSMAGLSPIGYKTVYPASKAFVQNFTRGLQCEFSNSNVSFSVVNPGPIISREEACEPLEKFMALPCERVAKLSLKAMFQGKQIIKLNFAQRLGWFLLKTVPVNQKSRILSHIFKNRV